MNRKDRLTKSLFSLRQDIQAAAEHYQHGRSGQGKDHLDLAAARSQLLILEALVGIVEALSAIQKNLAEATPKQ